MRCAVGVLACVVPLVGGTIEGRVTNGVTGEGVSGALVTFLDRGSHPFKATTDPTGAYHLTGLDDGVYRGEASKSGFSQYRSGASLADLVTGGGGIRVSGDVAAHMDAQLQPWGALRGHVVDEDGKPAAGVQVEISRGPETITFTDDHGEFSFEELFAGSYTVVAKPKATARLRDDGERVGPVSVYYPSSTQLADASPIEVKWGAPAAGLEIRLKSVPVRRVTGTVLDTNGKPAAKAMVRLLAPGSPLRQGSAGAISGPGYLIRGGALSFFTTLAAGPETEMARVESRDDGTFEFPAVPRGEWRVSAELNLDDGKPRFGVSSAVVNEKDAEGVEVRMSGAFGVEVTADWGGVDPPKAKDDPTIRTGYLVHLAPEEGPPQLTFDAAGRPTSVNGAFPGRYRVLRSIASGGGYVAAVMYDGKDVLNQVIEVAPGSGELHAIVKHDGSSLKGVVGNGPGATVLLVPRSGDEVVEYHNTLAGAGGAFEFKDVIPGEYYVAAFDSFSTLPGSNPADAVAPYAVSVRMEPSAAALPVNLQMNKWPW